MNDFGALAYLEYRQLVNAVKKVGREPGRAVLYAVVAAYFIFMGSLRSSSHFRAFNGTHVGIPEPFATAIFFGVFVLVGIYMFGAAAGRVGAFTSPADARLLIDSQLRERNVIVWLQLRNSWRLVGRLLLGILLYAVIFRTAGTFAGMTFAMIGASAVGISLGVPIVKLQRRFGTWIGYAAATIVALSGAIPLAFLGTALTLRPAHEASAALVRLGLGRTLDDMLRGDWRPIVIEYAIFAAIVLASYLGSVDLYPELYAASQRFIEVRRRASQRGLSGQPKYRSEFGPTRASGREGGILRGAWAVFWKEWIAFRRSSVLQRTFWIGLVVAAAVGVGAGIFARTTQDAFAVSISAGASLGNLLVIFLALGSSVALAADLRKPIWWLNADPVRARLYAWIAATSWRIALTLAAAVVAWGIVGGIWQFAAFGVPLALLVVVLLRGIGLALYAIFPSNFDQRGPVAMVRLLLTYVGLIPPVGIWIALGFVTHSALAGLFGGLVVAAVEVLLLVEFAAFRIARGGAAFAQAEA
jgi:hypothetical protein